MNQKCDCYSLKTYNKMLVSWCVGLLSILICFGTQFAFAYSETNLVKFEVDVLQKTITGVITDSNGVPIPGVNVLIKGTTKGTVSDFDGKYSIQVTEGDVLVFSYVGYTTLEQKVGTNSVINVTLQEGLALNEVVVIGYGTVLKKDLTGATSSISSKNIQDRNIGSVDKAMQGQLAGVRVSSANAAPGEGASIIIRGFNSITASNSPLYVIDGFPLSDSNPLSSINPADIESINVLKDASSTAIYGSRGSNGVVIITTKSGKAGQSKPKFEFTSNFGLSNIIRKIEVIDNREDYLQFNYDARTQAYLRRDPNVWKGDPNATTNFGGTGRWSWDDPNNIREQNWFTYSGYANSPLTIAWIENIPGFIDAVNNNPYNDWQDLFYETGVTQNYQLSVSGGTEKVKYLGSVNYFNEEGIIPNSGYDRISARLNLDIDVTDKLKVGLKLNASLQNKQSTTGLNGAANGGGNSGITNSLIAAAPFYQKYNSDGDLSFWGNLSDEYYDAVIFNIDPVINPWSRLDQTDESNTVRNLSTLYGEYEFIPGLKYRLEVHSDLSHSTREGFSPSTVHTINYPYSEFAYGSYYTSFRNMWDVQNTLSYHKEINKHDFTVLLGYQAELEKWEASGIKKRNYPLNTLSTLNLASEIVSPADAYTNKSENSFIGMFGRIVYNYAGKYLVTATIRRDGSSKFGSESKWGVFPSASFGWRFSEESFIPKPNWFSNGKLRVGYGETGNSSIGNYGFVAGIKPTFTVFGQDRNTPTGYYDANLSYAGLSWETNTELNLGLELGFLDNSLECTFEVYDRKTTDLLFNVPVLKTSSFNSVLSNAGAMQTRGFEGSVTAHIFPKRDFNWTVSGNLFWYRSRITDNATDNPFLGGSKTRSYLNRPLGTYFDFRELGIYNTYQEIKTTPIYSYNSADRDKPGPGYMQWDDVNKDGIVDGDDQTIIGSPEPDFVFGLTNTFNYKNFDLNISMSGSVGNKLYNTGLAGHIYQFPSGRVNITKDYFENYWRPGKTDAKYPTPSRKGFGASTIPLWDASYLNVNNITLGYTLPEKLSNKAGFSHLRIYATIQNALYISNYHGYNPELSGGNALSQGVDNGTYPLTRTISTGLALNF